MNEPDKVIAIQAAKAARFRALHEADAGFLIPNPHDVGSARLLGAMGFQALATTSSGFAFSLGLADGQVTLVQKIAHVRALAAATDLPVSADMENGFYDEPDMAAKSIALIAEAGAVGASIEDWSRDQRAPRLYEFDHAVERVAAAVEQARDLPIDFVLTARAEGRLRAVGDLDDVIKRLQAFEAAGADVLYAPGLSTLDEVRTVTGAVSKPVNILGTMVKGASVADLFAAGAKRISVGGALANAALVALMTGAEQLRDAGQFDWMAGAQATAKAQGLVVDGDDNAAG